MRLGDFGLTVNGGRGRGEGYVVLNHGQQYSLTLRNNGHLRCDAEVTIDGSHVGTWRIGAYNSITVDRPVDDTGIFTFFATNSREGRRVGAASVDRRDRGVVSVKFTPEREVVVRRPTPHFRGSDSRAFGGSVTRGGPPTLGGATLGLESGGTGLTSRSEQEFGTASRISLDHNAAVTIELRLVVDSAAVMGEPRPLPGRQKRPAPPPVGDGGSRTRRRSGHSSRCRCGGC